MGITDIIRKVLSRSIEIKVDLDIATETTESRFKSYTFNPSYFENFIRYNRTHQKEAINALGKSNIGQISLPTGTGKTRVQISLHGNDMIEKTKSNQFGIYAVVAPRLDLCHQLLTEAMDVFIKSGIPFDICFIGSRRISNNNYYAKYFKNGFKSDTCNINVTLSKFQVKEYADKANGINRHLLIVSTYDSCDKMELLDKIDIVTFDEGHFAVQNKYTANINTIRQILNRVYYFTATRMVSGDDYGMNDTEFFGEVLIEKSPKEMVEAGEILSPRIHEVSPVDDISNIDNPTMLTKVVTGAFLAHKKMINKTTYKVTIGAKLLISTSGNKELFNLHDCNEFREWCTTNNIDVYAFSAKYGYYKNFKKVSRQSLLSDMQRSDDSNDAIILHIDILAEGIDLPTITGVMPFRGMSTSKLLQTLGRASRLYKEDRMKLYNGEITYKDRSKFIKPYSWIIFPKGFLDNRQMKDQIKEIRASYDIPLDSYAINEEFIAETDEEPIRITDVDHSSSRDKTSEILHTIEDIIIEDWDIKFNKHNKSMNFVMAQLEMF